MSATETPSSDDKISAPSGQSCPPATTVQVQLLPDTLHDGLVAQLAEHDSLKVGVQGSTPCGATGWLMGVSSNGKTVGLHPANEGSTPSTVHCSEMARWWKVERQGGDLQNRVTWVRLPPGSLSHSGVAQTVRAPR